MDKFSKQLWVTSQRSEQQIAYAGAMQPDPDLSYLLNTISNVQDMTSSSAAYSAEQALFDRRNAAAQATFMPRAQYDVSVVRLAQGLCQLHKHQY